MVIERRTVNDCHQLTAWCLWHDDNVGSFHQACVAQPTIFHLRKLSARDKLYHCHALRRFLLLLVALSRRRQVLASFIKTIKIDNSKFFTSLFRACDDRFVRFDFLLPSCRVPGRRCAVWGTFGVCFWPAQGEKRLGKHSLFWHTFCARAPVPQSFSALLLLWACSR
jgi:hypothetical protein